MSLLLLVLLCLWLGGVDGEEVVLEVDFPVNPEISITLWRDFQPMVQLLKYRASSRRHYFVRDEERGVGGDVTERSLLSRESFLPLALITNLSMKKSWRSIAFWRSEPRWKVFMKLLWKYSQKLKEEAVNSEDFYGILMTGSCDSSENDTDVIKNVKEGWIEEMEQLQKGKMEFYGGQLRGTPYEWKWHDVVKLGQKQAKCGLLRYFLDGRRPEDLQTQLKTRPFLKAALDAKIGNANGFLELLSIGRVSRKWKFKKKGVLKRFREMVLARTSNFHKPPSLHGVIEAVAEIAGMHVHQSDEVTQL